MRTLKSDPTLDLEYILKYGDPHYPSLPPAFPVPRAGFRFVALITVKSGEARTTRPLDRPGDFAEVSHWINAVGSLYTAEVYRVPLKI